MRLGLSRERWGGGTGSRQALGILYMKSLNLWCLFHLGKGSTYICASLHCPGQAPMASWAARVGADLILPFAVIDKQDRNLEFLYIKGSVTVFHKSTVWVKRWCRGSLNLPHYS